MVRSPIFQAAMLVCIFVCTGCSGGAGDPLTPPPAGDLAQAASGVGTSQTHLWGYYDVTVDLAAQTATSTLNRQAMFTANVVNFINSKPTGLSFHINKTDVTADYIDVDIDVTLTHPFPGLSQYDGYDVRGVFMGDGSASMNYNPNLVYPVPGTDQFMFPDPLDGLGGPDGYTRWFNRTEFFKGGMPLFQYTPGKIATPGYAGTATLCPYKYFADTLSGNEDLWNWRSDPDNPNTTGVFSSGQANTRNYYLRFPSEKGVKFAYAILANWKGPEPADHPANAPEAVAVSVIDESTVYYIDPSTKGGNLILDISLWDWDSTVNPAGVMEDYAIFVESTVLSSVYGATTSDMAPTGGGEHYSTYHIDIPADNIQGLDGNEYWIIAECADEDYSNEFNVLNDAWDDPLAAFFRFDLAVSGENTPPVAVAKADPNPQSECDGVLFNGEDSYDPDGGAIQKYEWDWDNDGTYDEEGVEVSHIWESPGTYYVQLRVTDDEGLTDTLDTPLEIIIAPASGWAETWGGSMEDRGMWIATDELGNVYVVGYFQGTGVDFDPTATGTDIHSSNGGNDIFLSKFSPTGGFQWAETWGGSGLDYGRAIAIDAGGIYVAGWFSGIVDFDPDDDGTTNKTSKGGADCWLSKFDLQGDFQWVKTWGGTADDHLYCSFVDSSGGIYIGGAFSSPSVDFNPETGDVHNLFGGWDCYLSKFSSDGTFQWAETWGGGGNEGVGCIAIGSGNVYCIGSFDQTVDFDPGGGYDYHTGYGGADPFISCFSASGTFQWAYSWQGSLEDKAYGVCTDSTGNVYVAGDFGYFGGGVFDINPDPDVDDWRYPVSWYDIWLCKLNSSGSFQWGLTWGGNYGEGAYTLDTDESDNLYVSGYFRSNSVDFDPSSGGTDIHNNVGQNGEADIFLSKFDSSGNFDWAQTWGSPGQDIGQQVLVRCAAALYLTGSFFGTVDFDPGLGTDPHNSVGGEDVFLMKILSDGNW